jgi:hypothetical protein
MSERRFAAATERRKRRVARLVGAGDLSLIRQRGGRRRTILRQRPAASRPLLTLIAFARRGVRCLVKRTSILIRETVSETQFSTSVSFAVRRNKWTVSRVRPKDSQVRRSSREERIRLGADILAAFGEEAPLLELV